MAQLNKKARLSKQDMGEQSKNQTDSHIHSHLSHMHQPSQHVSHSVASHTADHIISTK